MWAIFIWESIIIVIYINIVRRLVYKNYTMCYCYICEHTIRTFTGSPRSFPDPNGSNSMLFRTSWGCSIYSAGKPNLRTADGRDNGRVRCLWAWSDCLARAYTVPLACPRRRHRRPAWPASWPTDRPASPAVPTTTVPYTYRPARMRFCPSSVYINRRKQTIIYRYRFTR